MQAKTIRPGSPRVAVFCGSNPGRDPAFREATVELGHLMCRRNLTLVYGGGDVGLMGILADTMMAAQGHVVGVIPRLLVEKEVAHHGISELILVETMHERKQRMYEMADVMVALPGGIGTFEEIFEALTWNQLGIHRKPCGLLNVAGYYDALEAQLRRTHAEGFVHQDLDEMLPVRSEAGPLLDLLLARQVHRG